MVTRVQAAPGDVNGAVIAADHTTTPFPSAIGPVDEIVRFGDQIVVISSPAQVAPTLNVFSLIDGQWSALAAATRPDWPVATAVAGNTLIVTSLDTDASNPAGAQINLIGSDGSVTTGAHPDDPWATPVGDAMTVWTGHDLVTYGADSNAFEGALAHPTAFDPADNTYRTLLNPPWVTCNPTCAWLSQHQGGDHQFVAWTGTRSLVFTSVGGSEFTALHDPVGDMWERIPDPPIPLSQPWVETSGRYVTVFSTNAGPTYSNGRTVAVPLGVAAVLDTETRTWSTVRFAEAATRDAGSVRSLCPVRLDSTLVVSTCPEMGNPIAPMALDLATGEWSAATDRQQRQALIGLGTLTVEQLASALNA